MLNELPPGMSSEQRLILSAWLKDLAVLYYNSGDKLVDSFRCADNVRLAEKCLTSLEKAGAVERGKNPSPSKEMSFFGVGGSRSMASSAVCFGFAPKDIKVIQRIRSELEK